MPKQIQVTSKLWKYKAEIAAWFFISVSKREVEKMLGHEIKKQRGWGQSPVSITVGQTTWQTCFFPSKKRGYDLPVKAAVRKAEKLSEGDTIVAEVRVV